MVFFPSPEQKLVNKSFDAFQAHLNETLQDSAVRAAIGDTALQVEALYNDSFPPNSRHGEFYIPWKYRKSEDLLVVPVLPEQADTVFDRIAGIEEPWAVRTWQSPEVGYTARYDMNLAYDLHKLFEKNSSAGAVTTENEGTKKPNGLKEGVVARTITTISNMGEGQYGVTRPKVLLRSSMLDGNRYDTGITMAHEAIHVLDILEDGPLYGTDKYGTASELRAYHIGAKMFQALGLDTLTGRNFKQVEEMREQLILDKTKPFTPDAYMVLVMRSMGKV